MQARTKKTARTMSWTVQRGMSTRLSHILGLAIVASALGV